MRFSQAWAKVSSQNVTLRTALLALSIAFTALSIVAIKAALKDPLLIERSCYSTVIVSGTEARTPSEIESFIREALSQRFNTESNALSEYLSLDEMKNREQEQSEFKRREMRQRIVINAITQNGSVVSVDSDRLITVGSIRSAFSFPLQVSVSSVTRTTSNPYGLILTKVSPTSKEGDSNERKK
ncbi:MAG: hypothetical protein AB7F66_11060 [Bacteriovoracia bacterium]